jgi:hypothetical protein
VITRPTTSRLVNLVRHELTETVVPAVSDPEVRHRLRMIDHVLSMVAVRAEHEIDWMTADMAEIEKLASRISIPAVREALAIFQAGRTNSLRASEVTDDHDRAAEILSRILEAADTLPADVGETAERVLRGRLDHGVTVAGDFELVAR